MQGNNYFTRVQAGLDNQRFLEDEVQRGRYLGAVRTDEMQTLKQLYEPKHTQRFTKGNHHSTNPEVRRYMSALEERKNQFEDRGLAIHSSALEEVEQEREIEYEVEDVREVQKSVHFEPLKTRGLHRDLKEFALTGLLASGSDAYQPMPTVLQQTAVGKKHGSLTAATMASKLYFSKQFSRVVKVTEPNDNFIRPCQWLLWSPDREVALVVSPEEANQLIPLLQRITPPACYMLVYAAPVTRRMLHFNSLQYYSIPTLPSMFKAPIWLKIQLGIFAGRLYFGWDEYDPMLDYLGVGECKENQTAGWGAFAKQPLTFCKTTQLIEFDSLLTALVHDWLAVRRKGQDFEHTPMGAITTGKPLSSQHPFFISVASEQEHRPQAEQSAPARVEVDSDSDSDDEDFHEVLDGAVEGYDFDPEAAEFQPQYDGDFERHPFFERGADEEGETDGR